MQSGCALNPWASGIFGTGKFLGDFFDLGFSDEAEILDYLLKMDLFEINYAQYKIMNVCKENTTTFPFHMIFFLHSHFKQIPNGSVRPSWKNILQNLPFYESNR